MEQGQSSSHALLKLLQITSPSLPVGAYSYSQGLEWAVEAQWVTNLDTFREWLCEQLDGLMTQQELPLMQRLYLAQKKADDAALKYWTEQILARRETSELRREERHRGRALSTLLGSLYNEAQTNTECQLAAYVRYCSNENITLVDAMFGYAYSWLDNQVTAGIKLVPLGQSDGQALLYHLSENIEKAVEVALTVADDDIGYSTPSLTMASCLHETQYCRLFRS